MGRKNRTDEELRKASDHLHYECAMFFALSQTMGTGMFDKSVLFNALLESFAIHTRALLEFFYGPLDPKKDPHPDDVLVTEFIKDWNQKKTKLLEDTQRRVGKEVAHLSYARQIVKNKEWKFGEIGRDLTVVIEKFIEIVPKDRLGNRWNTFKKKGFPIAIQKLGLMVPIGTGATSSNQIMEKIVKAVLTNPTNP